MFRVQYEINYGQNYSGTKEDMSFEYVIFKVIGRTNMRKVHTVSYNLGKKNPKSKIHILPIYGQTDSKRILRTMYGA